MRSRPPPSILLVEDNDHEVALLRAALSVAGLDWRMRVVGDGGEAIAILSGGPLPDAIILDLGLPRVTGLEVLAWMQANALSDVPVVVYSSMMDPARQDAALALGADRFVLKSGDLTEIRDFLWGVDRLCRPGGAEASG